MHKEQIFEKMNGFLAEGSHSLLEQADIEDEFAEGKECCLLYKVCTRQDVICVNDWEKMRMKMWRLS